MALASFFSDFSHETATTILPMFLATIGASAAALGIIEGVADATSSFAKLGAGWLSDKRGIRKPIAVTGYFVTAVATASFSLATLWTHALAGRVVGWFGRGIRAPVRDALLVDSIPAEATGRAFGFERAADTLGAVAGPAVAFLLVGLLSYRQIFLLTLVPGLVAVLAFAFLVRERARVVNHKLRFWSSLRGLPRSFRRFLIGVGIFGAGDFAHTLLVLRASELLSPSLGPEQATRMVILLYTGHNILYALVSYPIGSLGDRMGKRGLLAMGYLLAAGMSLGFLLTGPSIWYLALLFAVGGTYIAAEDALERAIAADLLPEDVRGTGFGLLATVNGLGDFLSSAVVGFLWTAISPAAGFFYAAILSVAGALVILRLR
jgi:MFS family permease